MVLHRAHNERHRMGLHTDFEDDTFTLEIGDNSFDGSGEGQAYTNRVGLYQRMGEWVHFQARLVISDLGTLTTTEGAVLLGFPYTFRNLTDSNPVFVVRGTSLAVPVAGQSLMATGVINTTRAAVEIWDDVAGITPLLLSELSVGGDLIVAGCYRRETPL